MKSHCYHDFIMKRVIIFTIFSLFFQLIYIRNVDSLHTSCTSSFKHVASLADIISYDYLNDLGANIYPQRRLLSRYAHSKPTDFSDKNPWMDGLNDLMNLPTNIVNTFMVSKLDINLKDKHNNINVENPLQDVLSLNSMNNTISNNIILMSMTQNNSIMDSYTTTKTNEIINNKITGGMFPIEPQPKKLFSNSNIDSIDTTNSVILSSNKKFHQTNVTNDIDYYVSSDIESINRVDNSETKLVEPQYPTVLSYLGNAYNKINIFKRDNKQAIQTTAKVIDETPPGVYVPKAARLVRRRVLNILDRSPTNWANALSRDDDLYNVNTAIYVSRPWLRNMNSTSIQTRDDFYENISPPNGKLANVLNSFKRLKMTIQKVLPFKRGSETDLKDTKLSVFDKMYRKEKDNSIVVVKPKLERFTRLNILFNMIANKTSNVISFLTSDEDETNDDVLGIKLLSPLFENDINVKERDNNSFFAPVFNMFEQIGNTLGSINKFKNEEETKNKDLAFNLLVQQQDKANLIYSNGKELTTRTLKNLVQAGKETVDETRIQTIELVSNKIKELSGEKKEIKNNNPLNFTIRFPWEVYYRAEIPFFEILDKSKSSSIEVNKDSHDLNYYVNSTVAEFSTPLVHTSSIDTINAVSTNRKPIVFIITDKIFPVSSFILSKIISLIPSRAKNIASQTVRDNVLKGIEMTWSSTTKNDLEDLNYSPVTNQIPFPLITDPDIRSPYQFSNSEMAQVRSIQPLLLTTDTADLSELKSLQKLSSKSVVSTSTPIINSESQSLQEIESPSKFISTVTAKIFSSIASIMNEAAISIQSQNKVQQPLEEVEVVEEFSQSNPVTSQLDLDKPIKVGRATELRTRPKLLDRNQIPLPSKADFTFIFSKKIKIAVAAALEVKSENDADEFVKVIGLTPLISALIKNVSYAEEVDRIDIVKGLCRLIREKKSLANEIVKNPVVINVLCDFMELPLRRFHMFQSQVDKDKDIKAQRESTALVQRLVRSSDLAVSVLRNDLRLKKVLSQIVVQDSFTSSMADKSLTKEIDTNEGKSLVKNKNNTTIIEYSNLKATQMARVASWGLGGVQWKPKQPGQKGLRILSLDGGGTRGVVSIAYLKEIMKRVGGGKQPHEVFDIICGTSTGGIIAVLLGAQQRNLDIAETLYDDFIDKVFGQKSNLKLVTEQAFYDESALESILYKMCGDQLLLDSNQEECPRVFCVSTKVNNNPPQTQIWRNYNYPPGQISRYPGTFRVNTITAVRATTAAPTFFTPVQWEGGLYCDGALVANNPTAIALQEAKIVYPGVPVELVVSVGTGFVDMGGSYMTSMGWDLLVNNLVASSTDTEDVHALLVDFLPKDKYFRFNPLLKSNLAIDEKNKSILTDLKKLARENFQTIIKGPDAKYYEQLFKTLRGPQK